MGSPRDYPGSLVFLYLSLLGTFATEGIQIIIIIIIIIIMITVTWIHICSLSVHKINVVIRRLVEFALCSGGTGTQLRSERPTTGGSRTALIDDPPELK